MERVNTHNHAFNSGLSNEVPMLPHSGKPRAPNVNSSRTNAIMIAEGKMSELGFVGFIGYRDFDAFPRTKSC